MDIWKEEDFDPQSFAGELRNYPSLKSMVSTLRDFLTPSESGVNFVKETTLLLKLGWVRKYLEDVKVVFLVRSPYDVVSSFRTSGLYEKWDYEKRFQELAQIVTGKNELEPYKELLGSVNTNSETSKLAFLWVVQNFEAIKHLDAFENLILKYEDVLGDTRGSLEQVMQFMGLGMHEIQGRFIEETQSETLGGMYSAFRSKTTDRESRSFLRQKDADEIEHILNIAREVAPSVGIDFEKYFSSYLKPQIDSALPGTPRRLPSQEVKEFVRDRCEAPKEQVLAELMKQPIEFEGVYFSRYPITNAQFCSFLNATKTVNEEDLTYKYLNTFGERCRIQPKDGIYEVQQGYDSHPCTYVNWYACKAFCDWIGASLPSVQTIDNVLRKLVVDKVDLSEANLGEKFGGILPIMDMNYSNELLNLVGNTWKWTDSPHDTGITANEYGGAFNSSKHVWNQLSTRHKRFGASNLGFQVLLPQEKLNSLLIPTAEVSKLSELIDLMSQSQFSQVENIFLDLDGTLHDFRATARAGMTSVFDSIHQEYAIPVEALTKEYGLIMAEAEKQAFREGKTSREYRTERFSKLLGRFSIRDDARVSELVDKYGTVFEDNLRLEVDVQHALAALSKGFTLYLLTEGPLDAQQRTIEKLGISKYLSGIYTSGEYKKVKETGDLFTTALENLRCKPENVLVVGDSKQRDIRGANLCNLKSVLVTSFVR